MLILSHRGYHEHLPENTHEAFAAAVALGVDGIETDIRLSADGVALLFHDRFAPDGREIAAVTHGELCQMLGYEAPTAESALERWPDVLWNLEIKVPAALAPTLALIERYRTSRRLLITSFWHDLIDEIAFRSSADCGLLVSHRPRDPLPTESVPLVLPPQQQERWFARMRVKTTVWHYETMDPLVIAERKRAGLRNFAYGLETPADHRRCAELGLDGIITDRPEFAHR